jgi:hypothetical protein
VPRPDSAFTHGLKRLDAGDHPEASIENAPPVDTVKMRSGDDNRQSRIVSLPPANEIAGGVAPNTQSRLFHEACRYLVGAILFGRIRKAMDAVFPGADGAEFRQTPP